MYLINKIKSLIQKIMNKETDRWDESRLIKDETKEIILADKYKLIITYYDQGNGYWKYSRGQIYNLSNDELICDIKRNYSTFHYSFFTKSNGEEWFVSGRYYTGQTIINLQSKTEYNENPSNGFCWANVTLIDDQTIMVNGCYWGASYEYKFFDFSNPNQGWKELVIISENHYEELKNKNFNELFKNRFCVFDDLMRPTLKNSEIIAFCSRRKYISLEKYEDDLELEDLEKINDEDYDNDDNWEIEIKKKINIKRKDNVMVAKYEQ